MDVCKWWSMAVFRIRFPVTVAKYSTRNTKKSKYCRSPTPENSSSRKKVTGVVLPVIKAARCLKEAKMDACYNSLTSVDQDYDNSTIMKIKWQCHTETHTPSPGSHGPCNLGNHSTLNICSRPLLQALWLCIIYIASQSLFRQRRVFPSPT